MAQDNPNRFASATVKAAAETAPQTQLGVALDEDLVQRLRVYAALQRRSMKSLVAEALQQYLDQVKAPDMG